MKKNLKGIKYIFTVNISHEFWGPCTEKWKLAIPTDYEKTQEMDIVETVVDMGVEYSKIFQS